MKNSFKFKTIPGLSIDNSHNFIFILSVLQYWLKQLLKCAHMECLLISIRKRVSIFSMKFSFLLMSLYMQCIHILSNIFFLYTIWIFYLYFVAVKNWNEKINKLILIKLYKKLRIKNFSMNNWATYFTLHAQNCSQIYQMHIFFNIILIVG